jgi:hypothetical protein
VASPAWQLRLTVRTLVLHIRSRQPQSSPSHERQAFWESSRCGPALSDRCRRETHWRQAWFPFLFVCCQHAGESRTSLSGSGSLAATRGRGGSNACGKTRRGSGCARMPTDWGNPVWGLGQEAALTSTGRHIVGHFAWSRLESLLVLVDQVLNTPASREHARCLQRTIEQTRGLDQAAPLIEHALGASVATTSA